MVLVLDIESKDVGSYSEEMVQYWRWIKFFLNQYIQYQRIVFE